MLKAKAFFARPWCERLIFSLDDKSTLQFSAGVLNLYSLIYPLANFKSKIYPQIFFIFSLLQIPIVIGKNLNFLPTKFTSKAG